MTKVFLVDDEIVIREGIRTSFPWEESGYVLVGEAPDGEIALPMIRDENPDILITDIRMPFMDGIRLCQEVERTMPWIGVIILSGYDDFNYARQAISLGVKEYLLKPITAAELREALDRVWHAVSEERRARDSVESMRRRLASGNRFVREKLLSALFADAQDNAGTQRTVEQMRALGINLVAKCYVVMDIAFSGPNGDCEPGRDALNGLAEASGGIVQVCATKNGSRALVLGDSEDDCEERAYTFANSAVYELERTGAQGVLVCIGETARRFEDIGQSMRSARHARHVLAARGSQGAPMRIVGVRELGDTPARISQLDIRPLHERLQYASREALPQVLAEYAASLGATDIHEAVASDYLHVEALITAGRIVREAGGEPDAVLDLEGYERAMVPGRGDVDISAARALLDAALAYRDLHSPSAANSSVAQARYYLSLHFSDPNLMLKDVAREVCMSQSRFSTVFSQETGVTFTEYLTALRLGKARELLRATNMRSSQIAFAVGYNDPHYFSYQFRRNVGVTPSEYRRQQNENAQK